MNPTASTRDNVDIDQIAIMTTSQGVIHCYFHPEVAPNHVRNFLYLAGKGFYTNIPFHRIVPEFVIQAGEARSDWRERVPPLQAEFNALPHLPGTLSAARTSDPNSATSQFYFVLARKNAKHLDHNYTVFGQAFRGLEVIQAIADAWVAKTAGLGDRQADRIASDDIIVNVELAPAAPFAGEIADTKKSLATP